MCRPTRFFIAHGCYHVVRAGSEKNHFHPRERERPKLFLRAFKYFAAMNGNPLGIHRHWGESGQIIGPRAEYELVLDFKGYPLEDLARLSQPATLLDQKLEA